MSAAKPIPECYRSLQPYLHLRGAAQVIDFYRQAFAAVELLRFSQPDDKVGHAELCIGDSVLMLAEEAPEGGICGPADLGGFAGNPYVVHAGLRCGVS